MKLLCSAKFIHVKIEQADARKAGKRHERASNWYREIGLGFETPEEAKKGRSKCY